MLLRFDKLPHTRWRMKVLCWRLATDNWLLLFRVSLEEIPDNSGGIKVAADTPDYESRQVLAPAGPGVSPAVNAV